MKIFTELKELINNTFGRNNTPSIKEVQENIKWEDNPKPNLPKYTTYDKTNNKYRIRKNGVYYGVYSEYDDMINSYNKLLEHGWDRRIGYDLPLDIVGYNTDKDVFTLFYSDGEDNNYEEHKQARTVKKRLKEIMDNDYFIFSVENHKKSRREYLLQYHYIVKESLFRLPGKSGKGIKITAREAFLIIKYYQEGNTLDEIYSLINFKHNIGISTVDNWLRKYNNGLMNISLAWIIDNNIILNPPRKKEVLKKII